MSSLTRISTTTTKALPAALLLSWLSTSHAFTNGRTALNLATIQTHQNNRKSIPCRAPVDVFYVDDESSEEHTATVVTSPQPLEDLTMKDLVVDEYCLNNNESLLASSTASAAYQPEQELGQLLEEHNLEVQLSMELDDQQQQQQESNKVLTEKDIPPLPTMKDFRNFALPCFGLLLSGPLLSLVDTAFVGLASTNAMELAALGPATALFDCLSWFLTFLNVVTTNMYSSALAKGSQDEAEGVVRTGSRISLTIGLGVMATLMLGCQPILAGYMGPKAAATPGLLAGASSYLMIRALSMPTFLLMGVLQSALLGAKDSVTPLKAIGYSTIVNVIGDYLLVNHFGMGLKGAAIATTVAQWAATVALILPARKKLMREGKLGLINFRKQTSVSAKKFLSFCGPVMALLAGKLGVFGFLTQAAARVPGQPTPLASHQIILSLFIFLCPFVEVINQTAQTFLPPFYAPVKEHIANMKQRNANYNPDDDSVVQKWNAASNKVSTGFLKSCFLIAAVVASAGSLIPKSLGHMLTGDVAVQQALKPLAQFLWWSTFLMGPMSATEGILLARHKTWFLAGMYTVSTAIFPYAVFTFGSSSVAAVWTCFSIFQAYRASMQTLRVTNVTPRKVWNKTTQLLAAPFARGRHAPAM